MTQNAARPRLGEEAIPPGEARAIEAVIEASLAALNTTGRPVLRGQHPNGHGCVRAEFVVERDLPADLAHGIFREPKTYTALVRFSNGSQMDSRKGDAHGMAIKLLGVEGPKLLEDERYATTQDFVLLDHPIFFMPNAREYAKFAPVVARARTGGAQGIAPFLKLFLGYFWNHLGTLFILLKFGSKKPDSPLTITYWSTTPYRLGTLAVKYSARPGAGPIAPAPAVDAPDKLRQVMAAQLAQSGAAFDFLVQPQIDPEAMPVEDPTVRWDETRSPFVKVASLRIPPQTFDSPAQLEACENLSFTVWHCLPEHRPLGGVNRTRSDLYRQLSARRHELNGTSREEPTPEMVDALWPTGGAST